MTHHSDRSFSDDVNFVMSLELQLQQTEAQQNIIHSDTEVDSTKPGIYRLWQGQKMLGFFWRSSLDGRWTAEPLCSRDAKRYKTSDKAQAAIVKAWRASK